MQEVGEHKGCVRFRVGVQSLDQGRRQDTARAVVLGLVGFHGHLMIQGRRESDDITGTGRALVVFGAVPASEGSVLEVGQGSRETAVKHTEDLCVRVKLTEDAMEQIVTDVTMLVGIRR